MTKPDTSQLKKRSPVLCLTLEWSGIAAAQGTCNKNRQAPQNPPQPVQPPQLHAPPQGVVLKQSTEVSVRILNVAGPLDVRIHEALLIPIKIKNPDLVNQLLLRVYDRNEKVVYHELLDRNEILSLATADPQTVTNSMWVGVRPRGQGAQPPASFDGYADLLGSPYRIEVWVNKNQGLWPITAAEDRQAIAGYVVYGTCQPSDFRPTPTQVETRYRAISGVRKAGFLSRASAWDKLIAKQKKYAKSTEHAQDPKYQPKKVTVLNGRPVWCVVDYRTTGETDRHCQNDYNVRLGDLRATLALADAYVNGRNQALTCPRTGARRRRTARPGSSSRPSGTSGAATAARSTRTRSSGRSWMP